MQDIKNITFSQNTASSEQIHQHLNECDGDFTPRLSTRVNIIEYSIKIENRAYLFEAWTDNKLVGLLAIYFNDQPIKYGYITNMSINNNYYRKGIANHLLQLAINYAKEKSFNIIRLEVNRSNDSAIKLYLKHSFYEIHNKDEYLIMELNILNHEL